MIAAIIPARYASTRFPGKPLVKIAGVTMIERVYRQAKKCKLVTRVIVATDDDRIAEVVRGFGGEVAMTRDDHATGTDRLAEVAQRLTDIDIIVNIQGDEPLIDPDSVDSVVTPLLESSVEMATASRLLTNPAEIESPQVVKVVVGQDKNALYFSRFPLPFYRDATDISDQVHFGHIGLYVYTRECLLKISKLAPTPLEKAECLEQLRALENGIKISVVQFKTQALAVDVPEDVEKIESALKLLSI
ncbi:MAG: 3-deoxy-manno-octulosonate cytidylyltransferase [Cyanobacteria bacterium SZAS-4]|nr:3-deoxy-manno-octulosonate cytidylyltransferase [Cyanobacteria bacterium SZAS-4]